MVSVAPGASAGIGSSAWTKSLPFKGFLQSHRLRHHALIQEIPKAAAKQHAKTRQHRSRLLAASRLQCP